MRQSTVKALQVGNLAAVSAMFVINILSNALPFNGKTSGELSDAIPNFFVPAGFVFSIWGVIYLLQFMFGFYQARKEAAGQPFIERVGPWSIVGNAANSAWLFAWHWRLVPLSLAFMLVLLASLLLQYVRLGIGSRGKQVSRGELWFVHLPTSVYLGWISVATVANVTAVLVEAGIPSFDAAAVSWTVAILAVVGLLGGLMIVTRRDVGYIAVLEWALFGIAIKQAATPAISATAWIVMAALAAVLFLALVRSRAKRT
ncbi:MAG: tryptophan-rich sensory protein [Candidatus Lokiarchaeota archaeon]|nr:tryptophan-rich sensory protein [Candidatus Lokiarchaeota archaeon]